MINLCPMDWDRRKLTYGLIMIAIVCFAIPMYRISRANKKLLKQQEEYYLQQQEWAKREQMYFRYIDSIDCILEENTKRIAVKEKKADSLQEAINNMNYDENVNDHINKLSNTELLKQLRARYRSPG